MGKIQILQFAAATLLFAGCATQNSEPSEFVTDSVPARASGNYFFHKKSKSAREMKLHSIAANGVTDRNFEAPQGRKMAFTASLSVSVSDIKKAISDTRKNAAAAGGYVKSLNNNYLVLAIPVTKGDSFLKMLAGMGDVTDLQINGDDVTEQAADLKIRIENLEKSRQRLLKMMDRTGNVRDLTQVERELTRVTTELERLQAADKNLTNRITYVTITVSFSAYAPAPVMPTANVPLRWINQLGDGMQQWIAAGQGEVTVPFRVVLPEKFFFAGGEYAVSGNNSNIRFREIPNAVTDVRWYGKKYAGRAFYKDMITKALQTRFEQKISCTECKIDGKESLWFRVETKIHGTDYLYLAAVALDKDNVKVIEVKGKKKDLLSDMSMDDWKKMLESIDF